uniref:DUF547 domain-containing protein n=1 Tax=Brassica oleracea var. oleracea TaxID=109376 RepID=A0A0D3ED86_BRAOL
MIRTMKSPSPLCEPRYSSPKPNNDRVALDTSLDLPPKSLSSTILMEDGQNIQKWHPNNLTEDSMKCLNFIYDSLLRTTRVMELEKSGPVSRSVHFSLSSKSFRVDNAASCLSKSMNLVSYKESRQQDPYGIFDVEASLARDIGPYKNLVIFTSSSMDSKCISSSSSVSLIRKLSGFESVEPSSKASVLDQHVQCVYYGCKNISANTIEHCILRKPANSTMSKDREEMIIRKLYGIETTDPNIIFALSCGTRSSPAVRIYTGDGVATELEKSKMECCSATWSSWRHLDAFVAQKKCLKRSTDEQRTRATSPERRREVAVTHIPERHGEVARVSIVRHPSQSDAPRSLAFPWRDDTKRSPERPLRAIH